MTLIEYGGTLENIKEKLQKYTLEDFSGIVLKPTWITLESAEKFKGCSTISGNFKEYSNAFYIITDDKDLIKEFQTLYDNNAWKGGK